MKHWHRIVPLTVMLLMSASFAFALDTPALDVGTVGHGKVTLTITAGATGTPNGFSVLWGRTPVLDEASASFTGTPTLNTFGGEYTTFQLAPNQSIKVEIGDLLTETGVTGNEGELTQGTRYYFAAFANDENGGAASGLSTTVSASTTETTNCTYTQGYWKNHEEAWPVGSLTLGTVNYTAAELLSILNSSVGGNGLISLAHQLIAAKLNIAAGADPTAAAATIAAADALIGALVVPPVGSGYLHPSVTSAYTQTLDDYNNGIIGPGHCGTVPAEPRTWGQVKALFK